MMMMTECPTPKQLRELALGQLADEQSDELFEHVGTCENCRATLETVEDSGDSLVAALLEPDDLRRFEAEPDCQRAVAKALATEALIDTVESADSLANLPRSIGEYDIVRPLGRGGMGSVYLARHNKLGREVALKVLSTHRLADDRMRRRFEAEMRAVGRLNHPNVVTAHDARDVDGTAVLVTEFINGLDLEQIVSRTGPLSIADACEIARQVAAALEYISEQGFVHRDVKPSNIMLSEAGEVKLLDLGLARLQYGDDDHSEITGAGQVLGTADYVAPEQVSDCRQVDVRADIYSLGCTLYKLLTGNAPFIGPQYATAFAKLTAHVSEEPASLSDSQPDAPQALVQLVDLMLVKNPDQRPQTPHAIMEKLALFSSGSELKKLAETVGTLPPKSAASNQLASTPLASKVQPLLRRNVPMGVAIGAGLVGTALGICLGIIIMITNPDGTKTRMELPEGSRVEISDDGHASTQNDVGTDGTTRFDLEKQLQSTWQIVSTVHNGTKNEIGNEINLFAFDKGEFYLVNDGRLKGAGTFSVKSASSVGPHAIDFLDQIKQDSTKLGIVRILPDGKLQLCLNEGSPEKRPTSFASEKGAGNTLITFQKIANSVNKNPLSIRELYDPDKRPLWQALSEIQMAAQIGPKNLKKQIEATQGVAKTSRSRNNLRQIGLGFHNFHDTYRKFPGTANIRPSSKKNAKMYPFSWRVAILPFIEQSGLYEEYHFDEPWDSEHNLTLLDKMPTIYRSPSASEKQKSSETNYQGFAGEQTALGTGNGEAMGTFTDGTSKTLLLIETGESVPWTKPTDIPFPLLAPMKLLLPGKETLNYLAADGAVHSLAIKELDQFSKLITRNGQEPMGQTPTPTKRTPNVSNFGGGGR